ncbi:hypothetical protein CXG81DRAFT_20895 [Caulochytrium protostelioides]|uniref:Uncharacterized protein n=1 Tax=Caulochytrium protostelioides TaxID=1555241 RepID=A0A4P9X1J5_9FUNG|nr:hypothetical protein CXG81DRAFT_20895 [Caulochytrium protostelioides]|eukprot:RKO98965.1 hypothetical protein CXG81DRAFT_20895 [Caulochytrium protostelioides]
MLRTTWMIIGAAVLALAPSHVLAIARPGPAAWQPVAAVDGTHLVGTGGDLRRRDNISSSSRGPDSTMNTLPVTSTTLMSHSRQTQNAEYEGYGTSWSSTTWAATTTTSCTSSTAAPTGAPEMYGVKRNLIFPMQQADDVIFLPRHATFTVARASQDRTVKACAIRPEGITEKNIYMTEFDLATVEVTSDSGDKTTHQVCIWNQAFLAEDVGAYLAKVPLSLRQPLQYIAIMPHEMRLPEIETTSDSAILSNMLAARSYYWVMACARVYYANKNLSTEAQSQLEKAVQDDATFVLPDFYSLRNQPADVYFAILATFAVYVTASPTNASKLRFPHVGHQVQWMKKTLGLKWGEWDMYPLQTETGFQIISPPCLKSEFYFAYRKPACSTTEWEAEENKAPIKHFGFTYGTTTDKFEVSDNHDPCDWVLGKFKMPDSHSSTNNMPAISVNYVDSHSDDAPFQQFDYFTDTYCDAYRSTSVF